jgi:SAM-dependent methyltransferase
MTISEKILLLLSRQPDDSDYEMGSSGGNLDRAMSNLCRVFPDFLDALVGKRVLDFGCGTGTQVVAMAMNGASFVLGVDTNRRSLEKARALGLKMGLGERVTFADHVEGPMKGTFDIVLSHDSMEHFADPARILDDMKSALNENGKIYITFGPPWFAPYGSHMHFFTKTPWVNILFSEQTVMNVRSRYRKDCAKTYEEVESGLNRMTVSKFETLVSDSRMRVEFRDYTCVKGMNFLKDIPLVRELAVNTITCVLEKGH